MPDLVEDHVSWRPDRECWWFRRRVPLDLISVIGKAEWRWTLKSRTETEARIEARAHLKETNDTIGLARAGNWPPMPDEEIATMASEWWRRFLAGRLADLRTRGWVADRPMDLLAIDPTEWALPKDEDILSSALLAVAETDPQRAGRLLRNKTAMARLLTDCKISHDAVMLAAGHFDNQRRAIEFVQMGKVDPNEIIRMAESSAVPAVKISAGLPLPFEDLITEWAKWQTRRPKTVYEFRRIIRKLTDFLGHDNVRRLKKGEIEAWVKHLKEEGAAEKTIEGHLMALKTLLNFAVEHDHIEKSPGDGISYRARVKRRNKIRGYTNAEARVVLTAARKQEQDFMRWSPWLCCSLGRGSKKSSPLRRVMSTSLDGIG